MKAFAVFGLLGRKGLFLRRFMPVYDPQLALSSADALSHLLAPDRYPTSLSSGHRLPEVGGIGPDLMTNIRRYGYTPSLRQLGRISQQLSLTIGGAFKLFGYSLDSLRDLDFALNGERTRLIDAYPFYRDRPVDLPDLLGPERSYQRSTSLSELVHTWRHNIPIRSVRGPYWTRQRLIYAQLGTNDEIALPAIPPGAFVGICEIGEAERRAPNPEQFYFFQHGGGYFCSRCVVDKGRLLLITQAQKIGAALEFVYPGEIRILGRVVSYWTRVPVLRRDSFPPPLTRRTAPMVFPWEHTSFSSLLAAEGERFNITDSHLVMVGELLKEHLGTGLSARTVRRHKHTNKSLPRTAVLLALTATHSLRPTDVLRLLGFWTSDSRLFSLSTLMNVQKYRDLPFSFDPAPPPQPERRWQELLETWGEWPTLLSTSIPKLANYRHTAVRIAANDRFKGLNPFIRAGAIAVLDEVETKLPENGLTDSND